MSEASAPHGPRPVAAFFFSLAGSCLLLGLLLLFDRRVLELRKAREDVRRLDQQIAEKRRENDRLRAAIDSASRHQFPAEKTAREELHLVHPEDVVLLYPQGSLSKEKPKGGPPPLGTPVPERANP